MSPTLLPFQLPPCYPRIKAVHSFEELLATPFADGVNALCWPRSLPGDFNAVVERLAEADDIATLDEERLNALQLSAEGRVAAEVMLEDLQRLRAAGLSPELNCIRCYPRDEEDGIVPTDVYSFHADSAPIASDTFLCSYAGSPSEGLRNEDARRCVDVAETRAALLARFGGPDDTPFVEYLQENCYDLHYVPAPHAQPFSFGLGNLWRIAVDYPGSPVPPCVHRAPVTIPGRPPRLLLIS